MRTRPMRESDRCCCGELWQDHTDRVRPCSCSHFWCAIGHACLAHCQCARCAAISAGAPRHAPRVGRLPVHSGAAARAQEGEGDGETVA